MIIPVDRSLQQRKHFLCTGKIHRIFVDLDRIGTVQCLLDTVSEYACHTDGQIRRVVHFPPEHLASLIAQLTVRQHQLVTGSRQLPAGGDQAALHLLQVPHGTYLCIIQIYRENIVPRTFQLLPGREKKYAGKHCKCRNLNICNFHFFIMSADFFHHNYLSVV